MKKVLMVIGVMFTLTACSKVETSTETTTDSLTVVSDSSKVVIDTTKTTPDTTKSVK